MVLRVFYGEHVFVRLSLSGKVVLFLGDQTWDVRRMIYGVAVDNRGVDGQVVQGTVRLNCSAGGSFHEN